jgi:hypothetical protein
VGTTGDNAGGSPGVTLFGDSAYPYDRLISTSDTPLQSIAEPTPVPQTTDLAPDWLVEAVLGYVPAVMAAGLSQAEQSGTIKNYQASGQHALAVAAPYTRDSLGFCLRPVM